MLKTAALLVLVSACEFSPLPLPECDMGLSKAHTTIPLGASLQTGVDPKLVQPGSTLELQNCRQGRLGEIIPRTGVTQLGLGLMGSGGSLRAPWALATLNDALVSFAGVGDNPVGIYSPTANQWGSDTGVLGSVTTAQRGPIFASSTRVSGDGRAPDVAYASGYFFVSLYNTNALGTLDVHELAVDAVSGSIVSEKVFSDGLSAMAVLVRVVNGYAVFIRYTTASDIAFDAWQISNLDAGPTTTVLATTVFSVGSQWDAAANTATSVSLVYQNNIGNFTGVDFAPATAVLTPWVLTDATAAVIPGGAVNWLSDYGTSGLKSLVTYSTTQGVRVQWNIPTTGAARQATILYVVDAAAASPTAAVGHTTASSVAGTFSVFYTNSTGFKAKSYTAGVLASTKVQLQSVLRSKTFTNNGEFFVLVETSAAPQETRFVMSVPFSLDTRIVAKSQVNGAYVGDPSFLSQVVSAATNEWTLADAALIRIAANPTSYTPYVTGIELVTVSFEQAGNTTRGVPRESLESLFVPGGSLKQFDGRNYSEAGFPQYPAIPILVPGAAGALEVSSNYTYSVVYSRTDVSGRLWRSAPSLVGTGTLSAIQNSFTVTVSMLAIADRGDIKIEVYRGAKNSTSPLQLVKVLNNDPTVVSASFVDGVSDATQATGEFLYTTGGGVLDNDPIPGMSSLAVAGNRMLGVSMDEPDAIWPSAPFVPGIGLRFSENTKFYIRDQHGPITGLAALPNGVVVAFKHDAIYAITGEGPDSAGRGSFRVDFIAIGLGSTNPRSIVETSLGCEFLSTSTKTGWYQINAGLNPVYIGGAVEKYVDRTIVGAVLIPTKNETRYYTSNNDSGEVRALVHNFVTGLWSVDTSPEDFGSISAACAYGTGAAFGTTDPAVWIDLANTYVDGSTAYNSVIVTPWIKLGGMRGYERIYRARGVGSLAVDEDNNALLTVTLYKNFDSVTPVTTQTVIMRTPAVGAISPSGDWEMRYSAKFESAQWKISTAPADYAQAASLAWTAIELEYGVKAGLGPISSGKRTA